MQFNTAYLGDLARYGITANDVAAAGCYSFDLAAWRLRMHIRNDKGDLWTKAANYHSRTPQYNAVYRADLMRKASKWADSARSSVRHARRDEGRGHPLDAQPARDDGPAGDAGGQAGTSTPAGRPSGRSSSQRVGGRLRAPHGVFQHFTRGVGRVGRFFRFSG